ncbi:E3 ubiquitin-protein ligase upl7 [Phtheirospermum japonicum]|uniref:HECT-type E3 ubiquitin transferase n=1 Tax=Phtheirospermum japonicum TaxID=374723 RepID=A0A830CR43_9LAMI|nr:E3 ubiquitin-protein ligase upl7 [Phtheirospermum japonicum]
MRIGFKSSFLVNAMEHSLSPPFNANATLSPPPSSGDGDETLEDAWYKNIASKLLIVVSLRGASAKEITRDALIERVNQERELRSYTRRANTAVMFIQRVWRRHHEMKLMALRLQRDWEIRMNEQRAGALTKMQISIEILRPFLFFINYLSVRSGKIGARDRDCINCFRVILENITSNDGIFLIVASAITLSLQPFHITNMDLNDDVMMEWAVEQYCYSVLTIPWFPQRLPAILVPALRHKSVLLPCLRMLLAFWSGLEHRASEADSGHYRNGLRTDSQQIWSEERGPVCDVVSVVIVCGGSYRRGKASCGDMDIVKRHHDGKKCGIQL